MTALLEGYSGKTWQATERRIHSIGFFSNSIRRQPPHHLRHLPVPIDPEPFLFGHARQLHVLGVQLLLHDLLQRLQDQRLRFLQRERLVEFVLQFRLCAFGAGTDGFGVVAVEGAGGFGVVSVSRLLVRATFLRSYLQRGCEK